MNATEEQGWSRCRTSITEFVNSIRPTRYSTECVLPGELLEAERKLNQRWVEFEALSESDWSIVRGMISRTEEMILWHYSVRMAQMAVRTNDERLIRFGLMALIVTDKLMDPRDVFTAHALLLDAAKRIHANVESVFNGVARLATPTRRNTMETYVRERACEASMDNVLDGLGYAASGSGNSFSYRSIV